MAGDEELEVTAVIDGLRAILSRIPAFLETTPPGGASVQNDVNQDQTSSGVQVQGQDAEQLLGGVAHEL